MSGAERANCPNIAWAHWKGVELELEPAEQLTLNAIAELADAQMHCLLTAGDLRRHTRLKDRTTALAARTLAKHGLIRMQRTRTGFHYWLERVKGNGKTHFGWEEPDVNVARQEPQKMPISTPAPDPQKMPISTRSAKNADLRLAKNADQDPQNLPISISTVPKTPLVPPVSTDSSTDLLGSPTSTSPARARTREVAEADLQRVLDAWNDMAERTGLSKVRVFGKARRASLAERIREVGVDGMLEAIARIGASRFCQGGGPSGWEASFKFILQAESVASALEGRYDNRTELGPIGQIRRKWGLGTFLAPRIDPEPVHEAAVS